MIIGVPKEIKNNENRVGMTPSGVAEVVKQGHRVFIQHTAGINSGFPDEAYQAVGAHILPTIEDIYATAEMIVKVKEPIITEYNLIRKGQLLFTYFHFASDRELTLAMLSNKSICLAYETVEEADHTLPLSDERSCRTYVYSGRCPFPGKAARWKRYSFGRCARC